VKKFWISSKKNLLKKLLLALLGLKVPKKKKIAAWHQDAKKAGWNKNQKWADFDQRQLYV